MPGMLTRSKSLRFLRNTRKDVIDQQKGNTMPSIEGSQTDLDKYAASTAYLPVEGNLKAPDLAVRPSTSGGPVQRPVRPRGKTDPAPSFHSEEYVHSFQSPTTSTTVLYTSDVTKEQGVIGIALGSPTCASHWNPPPQTVEPTTNPGSPSLSVDMSIQPNRSSPALDGSAEPAKPKISRWKSLFRKAAPPITQQEKAAFYQLTQTVEKVTRTDSHHDEDIIESKATLREETGRERLRNVSPPAYKPDIRESRKWSPGEFFAPQTPPETLVTRDRAVTLENPASDRHEVTLQRSITKTGSSPPNKNKNSSSTQKAVSLKNSNNTPIVESKDSAPTEGRLLDITLPDITLERYSVMFSSLLQSTPNRSSLLERRQGNAEKVKPLKELSAKDNPTQTEGLGIQRRVTSPAVVSASPRLTLFPPTTTNRAPSPLGAPVINRSKKDIKRSNTLPTKSPVRQEFKETSDRSEKAGDSAKLAPVASSYLKPALTPTSICSFESESETVTVIVAQASPGHPQPTKLHFDDREPEWELLPRPARAAKREAPIIPDTPISPPVQAPSLQQAKVTKMTALSSHPSSAPLEAPSPLQRLQSISTPPHSASRLSEKRAEIQARRREAQTEQAVAAQATVGLARSVSLSRAKSPRSVIRNSMAPNEDRIVDRLALTPTMVEVKNRKSQRAQVEDA